MAWEARLGLKLKPRSSPPGTLGWLNGLGSPFGIETRIADCLTGHSRWLNGLGSPFENRK
jgi:hypothetical protein